MKKKKNNNRNREQRLVASWTLELAYALMEEYPLMDRSAALRQAHLVRRLMEALGQGTVEFDYVKANGETRHACGTLCERFIPAGKRPAADSKTRRQANPLVFCYYDIDVESWRSFSASKVDYVER